MKGTATLPKRPAKAVSAMIDERNAGPGQGRKAPDLNETRRLFLDCQIDAKIAMLDTDVAGVALLAQTTTGHMIRIALTEAECLDMARTLLAKVRVR